MKNIKDIIAIVPAAGIGKRMLSKIPKQYISIEKYTIIEHTINVLLLHPRIINIVVVLNKNDNFFKNLKISENKKIITTIGGKTRSHSVLLGIKKAIKISNVNWVIVHDAVRPFINVNEISKLLSIININSIGGILAIPMYNTIKYSSNNLIVDYTIQRKNLWNALTPQLFLIDLLFYCLKKTIDDNFFVTDESSALEYCGYKPKIIVGKNKNIKITKPDDLKLAKFYFKNK